jgi:hypothetical protein
MKSQSIHGQVRGKAEKSRLPVITKVQISAACERFSGAGTRKLPEFMQATRHNCVIGHFDFQKSPATRKSRSDSKTRKESQHEYCTEQAAENLAQLIADLEQVPVTSLAIIISTSLYSTISLWPINNVGKIMIQFRGRSGRVCRRKNGVGTVLS